MARHTHLCKADKVAVWTAITLGFHTFLRAGELTTSTPNSYSKCRHLLKRDVVVFQDWLVIHIKASKTDQYRVTCQLPVAATGKPTYAMRKFLRRARHAGSLPLFTLKSGQFLTRNHLTRLLRTLLRPCGIPSQQVQGYSSHSLRIGVATEAASVGLPTWLIQAAGRWKSTAYKRYISSPQKASSPGSTSLGWCGRSEVQLVR